MSEQGFLKALHLLATLSQTNLTSEVVALYHGTLFNDGFEKAGVAMLELAKKTSPRTGLPTVDEIRAMIRSGHSIATRFDELVNLIGKYGRYRPPQVDYPLAKSIERLGGWQKVCDWETDELPFRRKDFDSVYQDVIDGMAVGNVEAIGTVKLVGEHTTAESFLPGSKELKALPGGAANAPLPEPSPGIDWEAIRKVHPDLDLNLSDKLKERGFFKLANSPGSIFRYCFGAVPGKGWPHSFVDAEAHTEAARKRTNSAAGSTDPNKFDSSKYSYERFTD
jgi:hypothetical protein